MTWASALLAFTVCHLVGDFLLQTDGQARGKSGGLGADPVARRALLTHVATYTLAFVPALVVAGGRGAAVAALVIAVSHAIVDDGRVMRWYIRRVKGVAGPVPVVVAIGVDQTLHVVTLAAAAALV